MSLDDTSQRNLDRIGGIIAAVVFGICFLVHMWQWIRYKCHPFVATSIFLLLRTIGWLLAFAGAVQDKSLLNKRGYIINAVIFWLLMLGGLLLLAQWDATCRNKRLWNARTLGFVIIGTMCCLVVGGLDVAGRINWLNNPTDPPKTTLKVSSVGFLILSAIYVLGALFYSFRSNLIQQSKRVRIGFFFSGIFLVLRCLFWMLVSMEVIKLSESSRLIFLFCLSTLFEMLVVLLWGFMPIAKTLKELRAEPMHNLKDMKSYPVNSQSRLTTTTTDGNNNNNNATQHNTASTAAPDERPTTSNVATLDEVVNILHQRHRQEAEEAEEGEAETNANATNHVAEEQQQQQNNNTQYVSNPTSFANTNPHTSIYGNMQQSQQYPPNGDNSYNVSTNSGSMQESGVPNPAVMTSYNPAVAGAHTSFMPTPAPMPPRLSMYNASPLQQQQQQQPGGFVPPSLTFASPDINSPMVAGSQQHPHFVKTPYPQHSGNTPMMTQQSYADTPQYYQPTFNNQMENLSSGSMQAPPTQPPPYSNQRLASYSSDNLANAMRQNHQQQGQQPTDDQQVSYHLSK